MSEYPHDRWITINPQDKEDDSWCSCDKCHETHILRDNLDDPNFPCCTDEVDYLISTGKWCAAKSREHFDKYMYGGICEECQSQETSMESLISALIARKSSAAICVLNALRRFLMGVGSRIKELVTRRS